MTLRYEDQWGPISYVFDNQMLIGRFIEKSTGWCWIQEQHFDLAPHVQAFVTERLNLLTLTARLTK